MVVAAILQHRKPLALGNIVGSTISNILGAFSLCLLFYPQGLEFDRSAKLYSVLLLAITTLFVMLAYFNQLNQVVGVILIVLFGFYLVSIFYAIYKGIASPPEFSDSDSDGSDGDSSDDSGGEEEVNSPVTETSPLIAQQDSQLQPAPPTTRSGRDRSIAYHSSQLLLGFLALSLSGYILSHSAIALADALNLSGTVFGLTIVSFATTLPEKLVAVLSGSRGQGGIMAATTAGSNIFLLTLCVGVVAVTGGGQASGTDLHFVLFELVIAWVSSAMFCAIVFLGLGRWAGVLLLVAYGVFLGLEFTVYRR